jgi:hypothetical protein
MGIRVYAAGMTGKSEGSLLGSNYSVIEEAKRELKTDGSITGLKMRERRLEV